MSLQSWKDEFYPFGLTKDKPENDLLKWIGLRTVNLEKHDMALNLRLRRIEQKGDPLNKFVIDDNSCSLCAAFAEPEDVHAPLCEGCPLSFKNELGMIYSCDWNEGPYSTFTRFGNVEPMIAELARIVVKRLGEKTDERINLLGPAMLEMAKIMKEKTNG